MIFIGFHYSRVLEFLQEFDVRAVTEYIGNISVESLVINCLVGKLVSLLLQNGDVCHLIKSDDNKSELSMLRSE